MKAERRHELQTNLLADWLAKNVKKIQPHANTILIGTLLVVGGIVAVVMLTGRSSDRSAGAWSEYYQATLIEDADKRITELAGVADKHPDTTPGFWARLIAGEARLSRGSNPHFKDRAMGSEDLDRAQLDFEAVVKGASKLPKAEGEWLLQRAHWGLARTFETLAKADEAVEEYETLAEAWPDAALGKAAAEQARQLKLMSDWYTWYASVDPKEIEPSATRDGGGFPGFPGGNSGGFNHGGIPMERPRDNELPDTPGFDLPNPLDFPGVGDLDFDLGPGDDDAPVEDPPVEDATDDDDVPPTGTETTSEETSPEESSSEETVPEVSDSSDQGEATDPDATESGEDQP